MPEKDGDTSYHPYRYSPASGDFELLASRVKTTDPREAVAFADVLRIMPTPSQVQHYNHSRQRCWEPAFAVDAVASSKAVVFFHSTKSKTVPNIGVEEPKAVADVADGA
ncbi:hypothetical protein N7519_004100 [Penicillium mononematosum]|uniref:uncharacterized protein n=1 Tax=Penicillium mononematosum TaxID=268346 RepID=UPI0025490837|nr:uncharacterized protein N7519_004100 [Penicillium mononematosum]KAJ6189192.1 hypothetical protein N7519_004100 [Penicillium mononematosum]